MTQAARNVVDFLLDNDIPLHKKRPVIDWYCNGKPSCAAIQTLFDTIPREDRHRDSALWFVIHELLINKARRKRELPQ
jgi:hypothetical protein